MKKILVYDNKRYLYRFIKYNLERKDSYLVTKSSKKQVEEKNLKVFNHIIFVYYDESDLIYFIDFFKINKNIILLYDDVDNVKRLFEIKDYFRCININLSKSEILEKLKEIVL